MDIGRCSLLFVWDLPFAICSLKFAIASRTRGNDMDRWVEISFDCLPLRTVGRLDIPIDASPKFQQRCQRIKAAIDKHGSHNSYYLYSAQCIYHLTNNPAVGQLKFRFEGVVLTDGDDCKTESADLIIELTSETCQWLTEPVVNWFRDTAQKAVMAEFDRYIEAGDLDAAKKRIEAIQTASDDAGGFVGMYL
ncbi:MAG: hypothetical protein ACI9HK_002356 [Pirellulaceae bacterium]